MPANVEIPKDEKKEEQKPAEVALTDEQLEEAGREFLSGFGYAKPIETPKKEEPKDSEASDKTEEAAKPEDEKKEEDKKDETEDKKTEEGKSEDKDEEKKEDAEEESSLLSEADELAELERLTGKVAEKLKAQRPPEPEKPKDDDLDDEDRKVLEAVERLQDSPKYKGKNLVRETKDYWKKEQEYISKWETENPGEEFDPADKTHAPFYNRIKPVYSDEELESSYESIREEKLLQKAEERVSKRYDAKLQEIEAKEAYRTALPEINRVTSEAMIDLIVKSDPEFKQVMDDGKGNLLLNADTVAKLKDKNPLAYNVLNEEAAKVRVVVSELEKLNRIGNFYQPDFDMKVDVGGEYVRPYHAIVDAGNDLEKKILEQPKKNLIHDGKQFITRSEWSEKRSEIYESAMPSDKKVAALKTLEKQFWIITTDDIRAKIVADSARKVSKLVSYSKTSQNNNGKLPAKPEEKPVDSKDDKKPEKPAKPASPSVASASDNVNTQIHGKDQNKANTDELVSIMFQ